MNQVFPIMRSHQAGFKILTREQKGLLMEALLAEFFGEDEMPELDPVTNAVFAMMQRTISDHLKAQEKRRNACRENGKLGGRPKKNLDEPKKPIGFDDNLKNQQVFRFQEKERSKEKEDSGSYHQDFINPLSPNGDVPPKGAERAKKEDVTSVLNEQPAELRPVLAEFVQHRKTIKKPLTPHSLRLNIAKLQKLAPGDVTQQIYLAEYAIMKGWQSFFLPDERTHTASTVPRQGYLSDAERRTQQNKAVCRQVSAELDAIDSPF